MTTNHTHTDLHSALHQGLSPGADEIHVLIFNKNLERFKMYTKFLAFRVET